MQPGAVKLMRVRRATAPGSNDLPANKAGGFMQELDAANSACAYDFAQGVIDSFGCFESCGDVRIKDNYVAAFAISCGVLPPNAIRKIVLRSKLKVRVIVSHFRRSFVHVAPRV